MNKEIEEFLNKKFPNEKLWKHVIRYNTIIEYLAWLNRKDEKEDLIDR